MASRRQQKVARVIRESVSKTILTGLSDPRVKGLISVTEVDVSPDMKNATVYLSILTPENRGQDTIFKAVCHAGGHFQHQLSGELTGKCCPKLQFKQDQKVQKTLETLRLIEEAEHEYSAHPLLESSEDTKE
ncbi:MAG: ribosome-binding factor A [Planctomycetales bacterium 4572_13]|nr:MAG: ribosome-binding factor A [Planctomycetales bacterium 4572_13]